MSLSRTHVQTEVCAPLCPSVGHTFVTLSVWRCDHHGALTGVLSTYQENAEGLVNVLDREWVSGPFTADMDLAELTEMVGAALRQLLV
jgi:hypothetical protein